MSGLTASFTVTNTGKREGATVAQLYMTANPNGPQQRLAGFTRVHLMPGASHNVTIAVDPRIVAEYAEKGWEIAQGKYHFATGDSAEKLGAQISVQLGGRKFRP
jgi:beta-glucosidase